MNFLRTQKPNHTTHHLLKIFCTSVQARCRDFSLIPYSVSPSFPGVIWWHVAQPNCSNLAAFCFSSGVRFSSFTWAITFIEVSREMHPSKFFPSRFPLSVNPSFPPLPRVWQLLQPWCSKIYAANSSGLLPDRSVTATVLIDGT